MKNAVIYLVDKDNRLLLNRRPKDNTWQFPGGHIDATDKNEKYAALRELCEEVFPKNEYNTCHEKIHQEFNKQKLQYIDFPLENPTTRIFFAFASDNIVAQITNSDLKNVLHNESNKREWIPLHKIGTTEYPLRDIAIRSHSYIVRKDLINKIRCKQRVNKMFIRKT
jgi:ADP-ribose pyrophosphatase YjhB (NUDIX family)